MKYFAIFLISFCNILCYVGRVLVRKKERAEKAFTQYFRKSPESGKCVMGNNEKSEIRNVKITF